MKLIPRAKPIKIRIFSGGDERESLESFQRHFCWEDVKKVIANGSLEKWLRRLGENEIADSIKKYGTSKISVLDVYNAIFKKKFKNDIQAYDAFLKDESLSILVEELVKTSSYHTLIKYASNSRNTSPLFRQQLIHLAVTATYQTPPEMAYQIGKWLLEADEHRDIARKLLRQASEQNHVQAQKFLQDNKIIYIEDWLHAWENLKDGVIGKFPNKIELSRSRDKFERLLIALCNKFGAAYDKYDRFAKWGNIDSYKMADTYFPMNEDAARIYDFLYPIYVFMHALLSKDDECTKTLESIKYYLPAKELLSTREFRLDNFSLRFGYVNMHCANLDKILSHLDILLKYVDPGK